MLKRLFNSKILRFLFSAALIYFAFRKVNIVSLLKELSMVPLWFVAAIAIYYFMATMVGAYRWSLLLFEKPKWKEIINFTKASYAGSFYSIFFPTGAAGDLLKWLPLKKVYPELSKTQLLSSVLLDRIIGLTAFALVAFCATVLGKFFNYQFPDYLMALFGFLFLGMVVFYIVVFNFDVEKLICNVPYVNKLSEVIELLKGENRRRLVRAFLVAFISEFTWITPIWFISLIFHSGFSLLSVYVFLPVITMILLLPISVAGFGARESLYLFFFSQLQLSGEKILLVSTFSGIITIMNALIGGLWTLF